MKEITLSDFLDTKPLTEVEKKYYLRKNRKIAVETTKTSDGWDALIFPKKTEPVVEKTATPAPAASPTPAPATQVVTPPAAAPAQTVASPATGTTSSDTTGK